MKKNLLKSLLALAALCVGTINVTAQSTVSNFIDFEDENVSMFTNVNPTRMTISAVDDATLNSKVAQFAATNRNVLPIGFYDFTELAGQAAKVDIEFDFNMASVAGHHKITIGDALVHNAEQGGFSVSSKNNYGYGANGAIFYFGSDRGNLGGGNENYFKINETSMAASTLDVKADQVFGQWLHAVVNVDVENKSVSYVISKNGEDLFAESDLPFISEAANSCTEFDVSFSNTGTSFIDNLSITVTKSTATFADYIIKYVDEAGDELKASRTANGQVGKAASLIDSDKASIYNEDGSMKYIYKSDDSESTIIAEEGTVVTVTFREAEKCYAVLNCIIDGQTMATGKLEQFRDNDKYWFWEGDNFSIRPAIAYAKDGKYYKVAPDSYNGKVFTFPGSISPAVNGGKTYYIGTLNYSLDETIAYHSDFERLALPVEDTGDGTGLGQLDGTVNNWWSFSNGYFDRFSQGRGIRLDNGSYVWTEPIAEAGTYMVRIYGRNDKSENCVAPYALGLRDAEGNVTLLDVAVPDWGSATTGENIVGAAAVEAQEAVLYEETDQEVIDGDKNVGDIKTPAVEAQEGVGIGIPAGYSLVVMNTGNGDMISLDDITLTKVAEYAETPAKVTYVIAGSKELTGAEEDWLIDLDDTGIIMTKNDEGLYTWSAQNITVSAEQQPFFKVVKNPEDMEDAVWYPEGDENSNWVITPDVLGGEGIYTITITFNPETTEISVSGDKTGDVEEIIQPLYVIGTGNDWNRASMIELPFDQATSTYTYEIDATGDFYFAFANYQPTADEVAADADWSVFNTSYRFAIGVGDQAAELDKEYQLVKVNGTIKLSAGKYNVSVTKDLKMIIKDATTDGINAVSTTVENAVIFNLKGQRVMNAQKGLYIQNGRKFVK